MSVDLNPHVEDIIHEEDTRPPLTGPLTRFNGTPAVEPIRRTRSSS